MRRGEPVADEIEYGRSVLEAEVTAIRDLIPRLDERFRHAVEMLLDCTGRVVVTGVGKSGLIGQKISATLASTGTPSLYLHSAEAVHGDIGRVLHHDVVLALSYSGTTAEVVRLIPIIKKIGARLIGITARDDSPLGAAADIALPVGDVAEACPIGLVPTSSTTAMLALGDALAMTVSARKSFDREDYALFHQGGAIGRKLVQVGEVMRGTGEVLRLAPTTTVRDAVAALCSASSAANDRRMSGAILVIDADETLLGIFTDGDLRRRVAQGAGALEQELGEVMTAEPLVTRFDHLLADAYKQMKERHFDELPVVDADGRALGILDVQDVLEWGVAF